MLSYIIYLQGQLANHSPSIEPHRELCDERNRMLLYVRHLQAVALDTSYTGFLISRDS